MERLRTLLASIDRESYKAYQRLKGGYRFPDFSLSIDHVQGDPFADPTRVSLRVPAARAGYPPALFQTPTRRRALEDYLARALDAAIRHSVKGRRGTGKSGAVAISRNNQQVLVRNAVLLAPDHVEARLTMGLPAAGRSVLAREASEMFLRELPAVVGRGLLYEHLSADDLRTHVESVEDQDRLRRWLTSEGLAAFIAEGSVLPRRSGIDDRPLAQGALAFRAPSSLARLAPLPNGGPVRGMAIPEGVTLIVGGGFHGKSTLLHALERGVYDHIPGDGRERVVTIPSAVKVRAEDGRAVSRVEISPFIDRLPLERDTRRFSTDNASGSTSQVANIIEAIECGARLLLIDEDTSATNFMIRDRRMQTLVAREKEPITPFLHRIRELHEAHGISTVIVMGGSGDYFEVADTVIMMDSYEPIDVTQKARKLAGHDVRDACNGELPPFHTTSGRHPLAHTLNAARGRHDAKISARDQHTLLYGLHTVDLSRVEQLVDRAQTRTIGWLIRHYAEHYGDMPLCEGLGKTLADVEAQGLDILLPWKVGNLAVPRLHELAAAINRMRDIGW